MAGPSKVTGPDGKVWTVRRRWFPWRRALSLRAIWHSTRSALCDGLSSQIQRGELVADPVTS